jgi:DNA repair protein RadC
VSLNARNAVKVLELVSLGTLSNVLIHPREVFTRAVAVRSASILVVHNHPSGDCEPSNDDITITERLVKAGKLLDINVLDHLILTDSDYYSFREQGLL